MYRQLKLFGAGDIIHLEITGTHIVVLNTLESASALLDAKGSIYSDRFSPYFIGTMVGYKNATTLIDDGPRLKEHRRHIMQSLGSKTAAQRFAPMAENWTCRFLCQLLDDPSPDMIFPRLKELVYLTPIKNGHFFLTDQCCVGCLEPS
jgi:cytochrome P450